MPSIKQRQAIKAALINLDDEQGDEVVVAPEPRTAPGQLINLQGKYAIALEENRQLQQKLEDAVSNEVLISNLIEVPGRRRKLSAEQFNELTENLRNNSLVAAITVRKLNSNKYEIISGHNRVQAFKVLGRDRIPALVVDADESQATLSALYANLFQPELSDFEKYLGFMEIETKFPKLTREEIAKNAGISKQHTYRIMSFNGLPVEVKNILTKNPVILGANAAQELAKLAGAGRVEEVIEAVQKLANGELDQKQAIKYATEDHSKKLDSQPKKIKPTRIMAGKSVYCDLLRADKVLRIVFNSSSEAELVQKKICETLENFAKQKK